MNKNKITEADLKKTAEMLIHLNTQNQNFEKQAKATELIYKQAEMGVCTFPKTFAAYQEKVAELLGKDLKVVEEAMKLASSSENDSLGGLDNVTTPGSNPREAFQRAIVN